MIEMTSTSLKTKQNKRFALILSVIIILLLFPFFAMQFNTGVQWTLFDFGVAAVLLLIGGAVFEIIIRKAKTTASRKIFILLLLLILLVIGAEISVGVFGSRFAGS